MKMSESRPEELIRAENLMYDGKVEEAFEIVINFEKRSELTPKDQLSALLLRGLIHFFRVQLKDVINVGEIAYPMSQELGLIPESIEALLLKAQVYNFLKYDEALMFLTGILRFSSYFFG